MGKATLPCHTWPREDGQPFPKRDTSPAARFPAGAEWVERMRMAGYEPFLGHKNGRRQVFAKGLSPQQR